MSPTQTVMQQLIRGNESPRLPVRRGLKHSRQTDEKPLAGKLNQTESNPHYAKPSTDEPEPKRKPTEAAVLGLTGLTLKKVSPVKRVRNYRLGPTVGGSPVKSVEQYLARKEGSDNFYIIKILTLKGSGEKETSDDIQGKTLLHTEHSLLDIVKDVKGVVHQHGLFRETVRETFVTPDDKEVVKDVGRICLVLDCYVPHDFNPKYSKITNMQQYVIKEKRLPETKALRIFYNVVQIVERLHKLNVIHRDLKLGNIIFNKETQEVFLSNFCLGKHLTSENVLLTDQRGSPAYISPDVISGKPYLGKPSDLWALGVVLYTMLYGQFPFYDQSPSELFKKIKLGEFQVPPSSDVNVSQKTIDLIKSLLILDPSKRLTATQTLEKVKSIIEEEQSLMSDSDDQVVPDFPAGAEVPKPRNIVERYSAVANNALEDIASVLLNTSSSSSSLDAEVGEASGKTSAANQSFTFSVGKSTIRMEDLHAIHVLYMAHKLNEAASSGKISVASVPEDLMSSGAVIKSAKTNNFDSAQVPSLDSEKPAVANFNTFSDNNNNLAFLSDQNIEKKLTSPTNNSARSFLKQVSTLI